MTERQRRGPAWQKRQIRQYPRERGSVRLDDAINAMDLRTPDTRERDHNANGGRGRRPLVRNDRAEVLIVTDLLA
jgi:hypothetical protein